MHVLRIQKSTQEALPAASHTIPQVGSQASFLIIFQVKYQLKIQIGTRVDCQWLFQTEIQPKKQEQLQYLDIQSGNQLDFLEPFQMGLQVEFPVIFQPKIITKFQ